MELNREELTKINNLRLVNELHVVWFGLEFFSTFWWFLGVFHLFYDLVLFNVLKNASELPILYFDNFSFIVRV